MGGVCSTEPAQAQSRAIDKQLAKDHQMEREVKKLLLLGAGECGKSTILKQVRIVHDETWKNENKDMEKFRIYSSIIRGMVDLCNGVEQLYMVLSREMEDHAETLKGVLKEKKDMNVLTEASITALKALWSDDNIQLAYQMRNRLQVADSIVYYMYSLDRITAPGYEPSNDDYLNLRIPTTGVIEYKITIKNAPFTFIDVGGQRSERRKWLHQFDSSTSIVFICAINEFDQVLNEARHVNRLKDSMDTYYHLINNMIFEKTPFILFLNKKDLFKEKIEEHSKTIRARFKNYNGPNTYEDSIRYIEKKFLTMNLNKKPYMHRTCATDTNQVQLVITSVIDAILTDRLKSMGIE